MAANIPIPKASVHFVPSISRWWISPVSAARVALYSDIHAEFERESILVPWDPLARWIPPRQEVEAIVFAGDVDTSPERVREFLFAVRASQAKDVHLIICGGNHESYDGTPFSRRSELYKSALAEIENVHHLENESVTLPSGLRILGTSLWVDLSDPNMALAATALVTDFRRIKYDEARALTPADVTTAHRKAIAFLERELAHGNPHSTVVVTHHAPSQRSLSGRYVDFGPFYASNLDGLIERTKPIAWLHGHVHESSSYKIDQTLIAANPRGYVHEQTNTSFDPMFVIDLGQLRRERDSVQGTQKSRSTHDLSSGGQSMQSPLPFIPRIVHVKRDPYDVYLGRPMPGMPTAFDNRFGNPVRLKGEASRGSTLKEYLRHLLGNWKLVEDARSCLSGCNCGACWCAPKGGLGVDDPLVCHVQVLSRAMRGDYERLRPLYAAHIADRSDKAKASAFQTALDNVMGTKEPQLNLNSNEAKPSAEVKSQGKPTTAAQAQAVVKETNRASGVTRFTIGNVTVELDPPKNHLTLIGQMTIPEKYADYVSEFARVQGLAAKAATVLGAVSKFVGRSDGSEGMAKAWESGFGPRLVSYRLSGYGDQQRIVAAAAGTQYAVAAAAQAKATAIAEGVHENWPAVRRKNADVFHARGVITVLGHDLRTPSQYVVLWAIPEMGRVDGSSNTPYQVALETMGHERVFNLATREGQRDFATLLRDHDIHVERGSWAPRAIKSMKDHIADVNATVSRNTPNAFAVVLPYAVDPKFMTPLEAHMIDARNEENLRALRSSQEVDIVGSNANSRFAYIGVPVYPNHDRDRLVKSLLRVEAIARELNFDRVVVPQRALGPQDAYSTMRQAFGADLFDSRLVPVHVPENELGIVSRKQRTLEPQKQATAGMSR